ncbi:MAG: hypothetical protein WBF90_05735 [Rivularia sp. (in: cyanobacteria)]
MNILVMTKKVHKATYRFAYAVKNAIEITSQIDGRSENSQCEYLVKLGALAHHGINTTELSPMQVSLKFEELYGKEKDEEE